MFYFTCDRSLIGELLMLVMMVSADQHGMRQGGLRWRQVGGRGCDKMMPRPGTRGVRTAPIAPAGTATDARVRRRRRRPRSRRSPAEVVDVGAEVQETESAFQTPVETTGTQPLVEAAKHEHALQRRQMRSFILPVNPWRLNHGVDQK